MTDPYTCENSRSQACRHLSCTGRGQPRWLMLCCGAGRRRCWRSRPQWVSDRLCPGIRCALRRIAQPRSVQCERGAAEPPLNLTLHLSTLNLATAMYAVSSPRSLGAARLGSKSSVGGRPVAAAAAPVSFTSRPARRLCVVRAAGEHFQPGSQSACGTLAPPPAPSGATRREQLCALVAGLVASSDPSPGILVAYNTQLMTMTSSRLAWRR